LWRWRRYGADSVHTLGGPSSHRARVLEWTTCFCVCVSIWSPAAHARRFVPGCSGSDEVCCVPHSRRSARLPPHRPLATALPLAQSSSDAPRFHVPRAPRFKYNWRGLLDGLWPSLSPRHEESGPHGCWSSPWAARPAHVAPCGAVTRSPSTASEIGPQGLTRRANCATSRSASERCYDSRPSKRLHLKPLAAAVGAAARAAAAAVVAADGLGGGDHHRRRCRLVPTSGLLELPGRTSRDRRACVGPRGVPMRGSDPPRPLAGWPSIRTSIK